MSESLRIPVSQKSGDPVCQNEYSFLSVLKLFMLCISTCRDRLHDISVEKWQIVDDNIKQNMARMASTAAWGLG